MKILLTESNFNPETPIILNKAGHEVFVPKEEIPDVHEFGRAELIQTIKDLKVDVLICGLKFLIDKDVFQKEITNAVKFTSSQLSSLPSLQGVFIELVNKSFTLKSTNLNDFYQTTLPTESSDSIKAIFDAKKVLEFVEKLEDLDDVQKVYSNFDIPDKLLAEIDK